MLPEKVRQLVGRRVRTLRQEQGLSASELAREVMILAGRVSANCRAHSTRDDGLCVLYGLGDYHRAVPTCVEFVLINKKEHDGERSEHWSVSGGYRKGIDNWGISMKVGGAVSLI
jgi:transcriptional regulator with XRE-family HTH domain